MSRGQLPAPRRHQMRLLHLVNAAPKEPPARVPIWVEEASPTSPLRAASRDPDRAAPKTGRPEALVIARLLRLGAPHILLAPGTLPVRRRTSQVPGMDNEHVFAP
ncbi:hypothetical protein JHW43_005304 [Diplocarpon mali]|nr:hypothetical protein JHW43_005304 [Diplocarpon mali]